MKTTDKWRPMLSETNESFKFPSIKKYWVAYVAIVIVISGAIFLSFSVTKAQLNKIEKKYQYAEDAVKKSMDERDNFIDEGIKLIRSVEELKDEDATALKENLGYKTKLKPFTSTDAISEYEKAKDNYSNVLKKLEESKYKGLTKSEVPQYSVEAIEYGLLLDAKEKKPPAKASEYLKLAISKANSVANEAASQSYTAKQWYDKINTQVTELKAQKARLDAKQRELDLKRQELELQRQEQKLKEKSNQTATPAETESSKPKQQATQIQVKPKPTQPKREAQPVQKPVNQPKPVNDMPEW